MESLKAFETKQWVVLVLLFIGFVSCFLVCFLRELN